MRYCMVTCPLLRFDAALQTVVLSYVYRSAIFDACLFYFTLIRKVSYIGEP